MLASIMKPPTRRQRNRVMRALRKVLDAAREYTAAEESLEQALREEEAAKNKPAGDGEASNA
jgi:hypothetical protein